MLTEVWDIENEGREVFLCMNNRRIAKILAEPPETGMIANVILEAVRALTARARPDCACTESSYCYDHSWLEASSPKSPEKE